MLAEFSKHTSTMEFFQFLLEKGTKSGCVLEFAKNNINNNNIYDLRINNINMKILKVIVEYCVTGSAFAVKKMGRKSVRFPDLFPKVNWAIDGVNLIQKVKTRLVEVVRKHFVARMLENVNLNPWWARAVLKGLILCRHFDGFSSKFRRFSSKFRHFSSKFC